MNIKIVDSWLKEHLKTKADGKVVAQILSLTSVSVERTEKVGTDFVFEVEVTTNRVDLMSIEGIAREGAISVKAAGIESKFIPVKIKEPSKTDQKFPIEIKNDPKLVNRICAVVMEVNAEKSPKKISERLEASGIRSINNLIDVTNYVMREVGHPTHVFDFDRLNTDLLVIRRSEKGEIVQTLDGKTYTLMGDDIVAADSNGRIVDLLGVMGTENSVVTDQTRKVLFFVDNVNPVNVRNTSMNLGIRTEAAVINEKGVDPELSMKALLRGIELYGEIAKGKIVSEILDIYPNRPQRKTISVPLTKIESVIGIEIPRAKTSEILEGLGFEVRIAGETLMATVPSSRLTDISIEEDIIEEIARIYGYHRLPSIIPTFLNNKPYQFLNNFYFENKIKNALKYLGFTEVYTYSLVSEDIYEGPTEEAVRLSNPLSLDMVFLRSSLIPSLLQVLEENKKHESIKIFEIANTYHKNNRDLPRESLTFAGVIKKPMASFFEAKGLIEALFEDIGVTSLKFKEKEDGIGADVFKGTEKLGYIEVFNDKVVDFEFDFEKALSYATLKKVYKPIAKFPPVIEDLSFEVPQGVNTEDLIAEIKSQSNLIIEVSLLDQYGANKTFHVIYQTPERNLTTAEISKVREKIVKDLEGKFAAKIR